MQARKWKLIVYTDFLKSYYCITLHMNCNYLQALWVLTAVLWRVWSPITTLPAFKICIQLCLLILSWWGSQLRRISRQGCLIFSNWKKTVWRESFMRERIANFEPHPFCYSFSTYHPFSKTQKNFIAFHKCRCPVMDIPYKVALRNCVVDDMCLFW